MPQASFTPAALRDLMRLRALLRPKNPLAAQRAAETIQRGIGILKAHPQIGRPASDMPEGFRELPIDFGDSGYLALYYYDDRPQVKEQEREVVVLALRHQRESGCRR